MIPNLFFGHEERQVAGTTVFMRSVIEHAKTPVALIPITTQTIPGIKEGTNIFTLRRFLVPWMMEFRGMAVFVDGNDMMCRADINELFDYYDPFAAVQVVKHDYVTKHPRKYVGTAMEADNRHYPRKNWCSVMIFNNAHFSWRQITPDYVNAATAMHMLQLQFIEDRFIGDLPEIYNWIDEKGPNPDAKIIHWTNGSPGIPHYHNAPMADEWHATLAATTQVQP